MYGIYGFDTSVKEDLHEMWKSSIEKNDQLNTIEKLSDARKNNHDYDTKFWITTERGERKYMHAIGRNVLHNNQKTPSEMIGINIDLTDQQNLLEFSLLQQQRYKSFMQLSSDGIFIMDTNGKLLEYSDIVKKSLGYSDEEMQKLTIYDWDKDISQGSFAQLVDGLDDSPIITERIHTRKDGSTYDAQIAAVKIIHENRSYVYAAARDISQQKRLNKEIREKLQKFIDAQNSIVILTDGKKIEFSNKMFLEFFGYTSLKEFQKDYNCICERFLKQEGFFHLGKVKEDETDWIQSMLNLSGRQRIVYMLDKNSVPHAFTVSINKYENADYIVTFSDISDTMIEKLELQKEVILDTLTGMYNRVFFTNNIENILREHSKNGMSTGVVFFDIDNFKDVNDTYGHLIGDYILHKVATISKDSIRESDRLIRWGGEEFIILCQLEKDGSLFGVAEHIREVIEMYDFRYVGKVTCSFGCAVHDLNDDIYETIKKADSKMYEAKRNGKNRVYC